jgi:DNA/RNA-binding domain of Phe-tRNA-synthetase-like protein
MTDLQRGWCASEVQQELPELSLLALRATPRLPSLTGTSPRGLRMRLSELSNRWRGARAINVRQEPVPAAYRVFFRQIGLDPDVAKTPVEAAALERMLDGGFLSRDAVSDALTIATMDTGVPVWALASETLDGQLGVRLSRDGERLGGADDGWRLGEGRLVVADAARVVALLFGEISPRHAPRSNTAAVTLFAIQVAGVPDLHAEEALWSARQLLEGG